MQVHQRSDAACRQGDAFFLGDLVYPVAQGIAARVVGNGALGRIDLRQSGNARRHGQHIVVEGAGVGQGVRAARVIERHKVLAPAEGAKGHAAANPLAKRGDVRGNAVKRLRTARGQAGGHHLIEDQQTADPGALFAQRAQKGLRPGNASGRTHHRLDQNRGQVVAMGADRRHRAFNIVVGRHDPGKGGIGHHPRLEIESAAMIAAFEYQQLAAAGGDARRGDGHQVRFGSRIGKAHHVDRGKARADERRKLRLKAVVGAKVDAPVQGPNHRRADRRVVVSEEPGCVFTEKVQIAVAIHIAERGAGTLAGTERKRFMIENAARVAAGHDLGRRIEGHRRLRVFGAVGCMGRL